MATTALVLIYTIALINSLLAIFPGKSLNYFYKMMNTLQVLSFFSLMNISYPADA
jgi:hypothetical protein